MNGIKYLFLDFETNEGAINHELTDVWCCSLKPSDGKVFTITGSYKEVIQEYINEGYVPVAHNFKFDGWVLKQLGIDYGSKYHCTLLIHYLLYPSERHSLEELGKKLGYEKIDFKDFSGYSEQMRVYCERDVMVLERVFNTYFPELIRNKHLKKLYYSTEQPLINLLMECEENGVEVNESEWESVVRQLDEKVASIRESIMSLAKSSNMYYVLGKKSKTKKPRNSSKVSELPELGKCKLVSNEDGLYHYQDWELFNPSSPSQVLDLFKSYGIDIESTDKATLEEVNSELASTMLEYRSLSKLVSSFGYSMLEKAKDGRLHPSYNQCVALTGRLTCSNPNLQQIPSHGEGGVLRKLFRASEGNKLVSIDIDSFQMRIYAWYLSNLCPEYKDAHSLYEDFNSNPNADPHQAKADLMGVERSIGKTLNFAGLFGQSPANAARLAKVSVEEMESYYKLQEQKVPSDKVLKERVINSAKKHGGYTQDLYGRRGYYPDLKKRNWGKRGRAERQVFNFIIQGTEASIMKNMWLEVWKQSKHLGAKPVLQVHDEFTFEVPEENAQEVADIMYNVVNTSNWLPNLKVTGTPKIGDNWYEIH